MTRHYLKLDIGGAEWTEVSLSQYISAEIKARVHGSDLKTGRPAASGFLKGGVCGRVDHGAKGGVRESDI